MITLAETATYPFAKVKDFPLKVPTIFLLAFESW